MTDPIVDEIHRFRATHAESKKFDLQAIFLELKAEESASGRTFIRLSRHEPQQALQHREARLAKNDPALDAQIDADFRKCMEEVHREDWCQTATHEGWNTEDGGCI